MTLEMRYGSILMNRKQVYFIQSVCKSKVNKNSLKRPVLHYGTNVWERIKHIATVAFQARRDTIKNGSCLTLVHKYNQYHMTNSECMALANSYLFSLFVFILSYTKYRQFQFYNPPTLTRVKVPEFATQE